MKAYSQQSPEANVNICEKRTFRMLFGNLPPEMFLSSLLHMPPTTSATAQHPLAQWMQNKKVNKLDVYTLHKKGKGNEKGESEGRGKGKGKEREREREKERKRKIHCNTQKGTKKHQVTMKPGLPRQHLVPTWIPCTNPIIYHCSEHSSATTAKGRRAQWF